MDSSGGFARAPTCTFSQEEEGAVGSKLPALPCQAVFKCFLEKKVTLIPLVLVSLYWDSKIGNHFIAIVAIIISCQDSSFVGASVAIAFR